MRSKGSLPIIAEADLFVNDIGREYDFDNFSKEQYFVFRVCLFEDALAVSA